MRSPIIVSVLEFVNPFDAAPEQAEYDQTEQNHTDGKQCCHYFFLQEEGQIWGQKLAQELLWGISRE